MSRNIGIGKIKIHKPPPQKNPKELRDLKTAIKRKWPNVVLNKLHKKQLNYCKPS